MILKKIYSIILLSIIIIAICTQMYLIRFWSRSGISHRTWHKDNFSKLKWFFYNIVFFSQRIVHWSNTIIVQYNIYSGAQRHGMKFPIKTIHILYENG